MDRELTNNICVLIGNIGGPTMKEYYDKGNRRLVYIGESATPDFWDSHWRGCPTIQNWTKKKGI